MIDLTVHEEGLRKAVDRARERGVIIPTFRQMREPQTTPDRIREQLRGVGLWDIDARNLFRITWRNEPRPQGGGFGGVNILEFPPALTGVDARIIALVGKWFPTGAHKVGAAFGCLVPRLVTGQFDPTSQKAVWPSTGNFCRGGAYDAALLACESVAILPEDMSEERFEWLSRVAGQVIKTPGSESNVKEIFDKCREIRESGQDVMIFNQFEELGNYLWHYAVTGHAMERVLEREMRPGESFRGLAVTTGSAGTIACGDYLKQRYPGARIAAAEALQCPTLLENGFGAHRIEGIGDKHVPWIHNVANTDVVTGIDDNAVVALARLFNEPAGRGRLARSGVAETLIESLPLLGFSGIANLLASVKLARYFEMDGRDVLLTVATDSMELYASRLREIRRTSGEYTDAAAAFDHGRYLAGAGTDHLLDLTYQDRRRIHNLKYFTWVEQQGRGYDEIQAQWYDRDYWTSVQGQVDEIDELIGAFNSRTGLLSG